MPSKDGTMDDKKKTTKDVVNKKQKQMMNQEEYLPEEEYDRYRDEKLMRGGDHRSKETRERSYSRSDDDKRKGDTATQKEFKKKYGKKATALDAVKKDIEDKYGKGAIMKPKKKDTKEELDLTQVAEAFGGYIIESNPIVKKMGKPGTMKGGKSKILPGKGEKKAEQDLLNKKKEAQIKGKEKISTRKPKTSTSKNIPIQPGDAEATDNLIRQQQGKPNLSPEGQKNLERISSKSKIGDTTVKDFQQKLSDIAKGKTDPNQATMVKGTTDTDLIRGTKPTGDEGQFRRNARKEIKTVETRPTDRPKLTQKQPEVRKSVKGKGFSTGTLEKGNLKFSGDAKYRRLMDKLPDVKTQKAASARLARKTSLKKLVTSPAVKGKVAKKIAGKVGGKFIAKRIPGVGSVISGAEAISRFAAGDVAGGLLSGAETVAGLIPGVGSVAGAAIGGVNVARDARRAARGTKALRGVIKGVQKSKSAAAVRKFKPQVGSMKAMKDYMMGPVKGKGSMLTGKTKAGRASRALAVSGGMDQMRKLNIRKPKVDQGVVGKRTAG